MTARGAGQLLTRGDLLDVHALVTGFRQTSARRIDDSLSLLLGDFISFDLTPAYVRIKVPALIYMADDIHKSQDAF